MKNSYIEEIGELSVLNELLKKDYEAYRANSRIQENWDLVVILENNYIKRIQVKTTILQNKSTNNSFKLKEGFDFLILVVIDTNNKFAYYILTNEETKNIQGGKIKFTVSKSKNKSYKVIDDIEGYINKWDKIKNV